MHNRAALKSATRGAHDRAEATWTGKDGFKGQDAYLSWLRAMLRTHVDFGLPAAQRLADQDLIAHEVARLDALCSDLSVNESIRPIAGHHSLSWAWGVQYVVNGSALGASILLKSGGVDPGWPKAYLIAMQDFARNGSLHAFFQRLDATNLDLTEAKHGAEAAFSNLVVIAA